MKRAITMVIMCITVQLSFAQTEAETLEWLRVKKIDVSESESRSNILDYYSPGKTLLFQSNLIKVASTDGSWSSINWENIKDIKLDKPFIKIISGSDYKENEKYYIRICIYDNIVRDKYLKALKHMAELKGAVLLKEDLF